MTTMIYGHMDLVSVPLQAVLYMMHSHLVSIVTIAIMEDTIVVPICLSALISIHIISTPLRGRFPTAHWPPSSQYGPPLPSILMQILHLQRCTSLRLSYSLT